MALNAEISSGNHRNAKAATKFGAGRVQDVDAAAHAKTAPASARSTIEKQDERAYTTAGATASVQFAAYDGGWIAEFRFRLRSGLYQGCTLPLTTSSDKLRSPVQAIGDAAARLLVSLASSIDGAELTTSQKAAVEALQAWANELIADAVAEVSGPLVGARFLDVFAGIGGFHIALATLGATCAGAIEIDEEARRTYRENHLGDYPIAQDIRTARAADFGRVDVVCGGFPCQSFSQAGDGQGFNAATKGALFFDLARLIGELSPSVAILENVAALASHDSGATFEKIADTLTALGYSVSTRLLNASDFGLPQMRERLFLVCVHDSALVNRVSPFVFPRGADASRVVKDILEPRCFAPFCARPMEAVKRPPKARSSRIETVGLIEGKPHQGYRVASTLGKGFTLCANSGGAGGKTGLYLVNGKPRKLSERECARMQGFPEAFTPHSRAAVALRQFGNSVAVPVVAALARAAAPLVSHGSDSARRLKNGAR